MVERPTGLEFSAHSLIHMGKGWYHWIDVKVFGWSPEAERSPISQWLEHDQFNDHYCGPENSATANAPALHGPYWASAVGLDAFDLVPPEDALGALRRFCREFEAPADALADVEREVVGPLVAADAVWRLAPLDGHAVHEWGQVLDDFAEYVILGASGTEVRVVVVGGD